jgi:hypothetical protein
VVVHARMPQWVRSELREKGRGIYCIIPYRTIGQGTGTGVETEMHPDKDGDNLATGSTTI